MIKIEPIGSMPEVRGRLCMLGWKSLQAWADAHKFPRPSVYQAIKTWGLRSDRTPHGGVSRAIIKELRATLAEERRPVVVKALLDDGTEVMGQSGGLFAGHEETRMAA